MYDRVHYLFSFGGTALTNTEIWQTGFRQAPEPDKTESDLLNALDQISLTDCLTALGAVIKSTDMNTQFHNSLVLRWCKLAVIKKDGKYAGAPKVAEGTHAGYGTAGNPPPAQLAWVVTLGTGKSFGMAQSGRMYWPVPASAPALINAQNGQTTAGQSVAFRDLIKPALDACEGEISTLLVPSFLAVMSKSGGVTAPQAPGTTNAVTELSVGKALDTMRSRRSNVQEVYEPTPSFRGERDELYAPPRQGRAAAKTARGRA